MSRAALTAVLAGAAFLAAPLAADASPYHNHWRMHAQAYHAPPHGFGYGFGHRRFAHGPYGFHHRFGAYRGYGYPGVYAPYVTAAPYEVLAPSFRPVSVVTYVEGVPFRPVRVYYTPQQQPYYNVPPYLVQ